MSDVRAWWRAVGRVQSSTSAARPCSVRPRPDPHGRRSAIKRRRAKSNIQLLLLLVVDNMNATVVHSIADLSPATIPALVMHEIPKYRGVEARVCPWSDVILL